MVIGVPVNFPVRRILSAGIVSGLGVLSLYSLVRGIPVIHSLPLLEERISSIHESGWRPNGQGLCGIWAIVHLTSLMSDITY